MVLCLKGRGAVRSRCARTHPMRQQASFGPPPLRKTNDKRLTTYVAGIAAAMAAHVIAVVISALQSACGFGACD
jgi:hypothetical protein